MVIAIEIVGGILNAQNRVEIVIPERGVVAGAFVVFNHMRGERYPVGIHDITEQVGDGQVAGVVGAGVEFDHWLSVSVPGDHVQVDHAANILIEAIHIRGVGFTAEKSLLLASEQHVAESAVEIVLAEQIGGDQYGDRSAGVIVRAGGDRAAGHIVQVGGDQVDAGGVADAALLRYHVAPLPIRGVVVVMIRNR